MKNSKYSEEKNNSVPPKGGSKRVRGKSYLRETEPSKRSINLYLSTTVIQKISKIAKDLGISRSELIEQHFRQLNEKDLKDN